MNAFPFQLLVIIRTNEVELTVKRPKSVCSCSTLLMHIFSAHSPERWKSLKRIGNRLDKHDFKLIFMIIHDAANVFVLFKIARIKAFSLMADVFVACQISFGLSCVAVRCSLSTKSNNQRLKWHARLRMNENAALAVCLRFTWSNLKSVIYFIDLIYSM